MYEVVSGGSVGREGCRSSVIPPFFRVAACWM